jgi:hypothetical protein
MTMIGRRALLGAGAALAVMPARAQPWRPARTVTIPPFPSL